MVAQCPEPGAHDKIIIKILSFNVNKHVINGSTIIAVFSSTVSLD